MPKIKILENPKLYFEWSHHTVGLLNMSSFTDFGSERVKQLELVDLHVHVYIEVIQRKSCVIRLSIFTGQLYVFEPLDKKKQKLMSKNAQPSYTTFHWVN